TVKAVTIGVTLGWIFAARLFDGVLIGAVVGSVAIVGIVQRRAGLAHAALAIAASLPFVALLATQQKAATGSVFVPTHSEHFRRSDWPPDCHRVGFGKGIGCTIEHPESTAEIGADGYGLDDFIRVVRQRGSALGGDLFGVGALGVIAFLVLLRRPSPALGWLV